jgi:hypothetical protein
MSKKPTKAELRRRAAADGYANLVLAILRKAVTKRAKK